MRLSIQVVVVRSITVTQVTVLRLTFKSSYSEAYCFQLCAVLNVKCKCDVRTWIPEEPCGLFQ